MKKVICMVIIMTISLLCFAACGASTETIEWTDIYLNNLVPKPQSLMVELFSNSEEHLSVDIHKISLDEFKEYIDMCKQYGFTIEPQQDDNSFDAYNGTGYKLSLYYYAKDKEMEMQLSASEQYSTVDWGSVKMLDKIPKPKSLSGKIIASDTEHSEVHISGMTTDDFVEYVNVCIQSGFNKDISNQGKVYSALNKDGFELTIEYIGNKVISIIVKQPEYMVTVEVERVENLVFSTYDVDIYINDNFIGTIENGATETYSIELKKGNYIITFENCENSEITGKVNISVSDESNFKFKINCNSTAIIVEPESSNEVAQTTVGAKSEVTVTTTTQVKSVKKAFVRDMSEYDLYYLFDEDNKSVVYFSYEQGFADKGTYTGDFSTGVLITWDHGEFTDSFRHNKYSSIGYLIDANGFEWEYWTCDADKAQQVLDLIK